MEVQVDCKGLDIDSEILTMARAALIASLAPYAGAVASAFLRAESFDGEGRREKRFSIRIDFRRGGRLILNVSSSDWHDAVARMAGRVGSSVERELERRWEPLAA